MTALVKNTSQTRFAPAPKSAPTGSFAEGFGGFGPVVDRQDRSRGFLGRTVLTVLLVVYPAMASVALVLAAFVLAGHGAGV